MPAATAAVVEVLSHKHSLDVWLKSRGPANVEGADKRFKLTPVHYRKLQALYDRCCQRMRCAAILTTHPRQTAMAPSP